MTQAQAEAELWGELIARSVALCRQDRDRWRRCEDLSDRLEQAGLDAATAVRRALQQFGA